MGILSTPKQRLNLNPGEKPYTEELSYPSAYLLYVRKAGKKKDAGVWIVRLYDSKTRKQRKETFGTADDFVESDNINIFNYYEAKEKAVEIAKRFAAEFEEGISGKSAKRKSEYTVKEACEDYIEKLKRDGKKSWKKYKFMIDAHIISELGEIKVKDLRRERVEIWRSKMAETPRRRNIKTSISRVRIEFKEPPKTDEEIRKRRVSANHTMALLKAALNNALKYGNIDEPKFGSWAYAEKFEGVDESRAYFLTVEEIKNLLAAIDNISFKNLCLGAYHSGGRFKEIVSLRVRDYNKEHQNIHFGVYGKTKSKGSRYVKLTDEGTAFFNMIIEGKEPNELIFTKSKYFNRLEGKKDEDNMLWKDGEQSYYMTKYCKKAGIDSEKAFFHVFRHVFASIRLNNGMSLSAIAYLLGHRNTEMVERFYGHLAKENVDEMSIRNIPKLTD